MEIRFADANGFDTQADGADMAVIVFTRAEVEAGHVGSAVERLMLLSDHPKHVRRFANKIVLLFSGYDDDPRALAQIPECVRFFRAIDEQWSYWLHFLLPEAEILNLVLLLRVDVRVHVRRGVQVGYELNDRNQVRDALYRWFAAMNTLHDMHGIDATANKEQSRAVMAALQKWT